MNGEKSDTKDAEGLKSRTGAARAGDRDSSTPSPNLAAQGLPCLEGLSFRVFSLLRDRAHFNRGTFPAFADDPMRDPRLSTAHLHPEERGFGCGCAAVPGSLVPAVPNWLQPSTPGSIPSPQQLLITKLFTGFSEALSDHADLCPSAITPQAVLGAYPQLVWALPGLQH